MSVANVSVHASMLNEDILAFNMTSRVHKQFSLFGWFFVNNTAKWWYCVTPEYCYFLCFSQDSVATHCRCGGKYDTGPVANLRTSPTGQKIWKSVNIYQSYERISSGKFFMAHSAFVFVFYLLNISFFQRHWSDSRVSGCCNKNVLGFTCDWYFSDCSTIVSCCIILYCCCEWKDIDVTYITVWIYGSRNVYIYV